MTNTSTSPATRRLAEQGITQRDLAAILKRTQASVSLILAGERAFPDQVESTIAAALHGGGMSASDAISEAVSIRRLAETAEGLA